MSSARARRRSSSAWAGLGCVTSARGRGSRQRRYSAPGFSLIYGEKWPRTGSATQPSFAGSDSDMPTGYSGTPLAKKLGIKPGSTVALLDAPAEWSVPELPADVRTKRARRSTSAFKSVDVVVAFCRNSSDVVGLLPLVTALQPAGSLWVAWPRKAAGHVSDIT